MTERIIVINSIEPSPLSLRMPFGIELALGLTFLKQDLTPQDPTPLYPQLALLPRSATQVYAYDVDTTNVAEGTAAVTVPGTALVDRNGYNLELYQRRAALNPDDPPVPVGLLARGVLRLDGDAYTQIGPLAMIGTPVIVGPVGPAGAAGISGAQGQRGSIWTTGAGAPTATDALVGDMYLDEATGNVWRWSGEAWVMGMF